eukprot:4668315-Amphidinium_carterae.1
MTYSVCCRPTSKQLCYAVLHTVHRYMEARRAIAYQCRSKHNNSLGKHKRKTTGRHHFVPLSKCTNVIEHKTPLTVASGSKAGHTGINHQA